MTIQDWQWVIWGMGLIYGIPPMISLYNKLAGLITGAILMFIATGFSLSSAVPFWESFN